MFAKALLILASIAAAFAYPEITEPVSSTIYQAGASSLIVWRDNGTAPSLASFGNATISIYVGGQNQQSFLQPVSRGINVASTTQIAFTPEPIIGQNSDQYFIRIESISLRDGQYPAMVFSAKFTLTGMTGKFNDSVISQINAQPSTSRPAPTGSTTKLTSPSLTVTSTSKPSSASASATKSASAAESIVFHGSWIGFLLSAFIGVVL